MASQVLSGSSNVSYTNNTGQNVRVVINYMQGTVSQPTGDINTAPPLQSTSGSTGITLSWAGVSVNAPATLAIGRNLACYVGSGSELFSAGSGLALGLNNMVVYDTSPSNRSNGALPTELMLSPGQTFSAMCTAYNIVVIPEAG
jgi:hypothetical protein